MGARPDTSLAGLRVLCVDNERGILDAMEGLLSGWGVDVRSARSLKDIDKDQILNAYLNVIYWGDGGSRDIIGAGSAANAYFRKNAADLNLAIAAASSMVIVNTVVLVQARYGLGQTATAVTKMARR